MSETNITLDAIREIMEEELSKKDVEKIRKAIEEVKEDKSVRFV